MLISVGKMYQCVENGVGNAYGVYYDLRVGDLIKVIGTGSLIEFNLIKPYGMRPVLLPVEDFKKLYKEY